MTTYYVTADLDRAPTTQEAKEIGVPRAKVALGHIKAILMASSAQEALSKGRQCIDGCIQPGRTIGSVDCMPVADAKKLGGEAVYKSYPTATWLLYYRLRSGMTQSQLAAAAGVNIRQIQRVELGEALPGNLTAANLLSLADALGVDPHGLL